MVDQRLEIDGDVSAFRLLWAKVPAFAGEDPLSVGEANEVLIRMASLCGKLSAAGVFIREMDEFVSWYGKMLLCPTGIIHRSPVLNSDRDNIINRANEWLSRSMRPRSVGNSSKPGTDEKPLRDAEITADVELLRQSGLTRKEAEASVESRYRGSVSAKHAVDRTRKRRREKNPD